MSLADYGLIDVPFEIFQGFIFICLESDHRILPSGYPLLREPSILFAGRHVDC